jgi:hypothetical protein
MRHEAKQLSNEWGRMKIKQNRDILSFTYYFISPFSIVAKQKGLASIYTHT